MVAIWVCFLSMVWECLGWWRKLTFLAIFIPMSFTLKWQRCHTFVTKFSWTFGKYMFNPNMSFSIVFCLFVKQMQRLADMVDMYVLIVYKTCIRMMVCGNIFHWFIGQTHLLGIHATKLEWVESINTYLKSPIWAYDHVLISIKRNQVTIIIVIVIGIDTKIEVIVVSPTTWEAHHSPRAKPEGCGELPRSLVTPQWPKSRYQFRFYHDAPKYIKFMQIRVCISRKSFIKPLQISHYGKHGHRPLSQQLP